jgi:hypothetical protein
VIALRRAQPRIEPTFASRWSVTIERLRFASKGLRSSDPTWYQAKDSIH